MPDPTMTPSDAASVLRESLYERVGDGLSHKEQQALTTILDERERLRIALKQALPHLQYAQDLSDDAMLAYQTARAALNPEQPEVGDG